MLRALLVLSLVGVGHASAQGYLVGVTSESGDRVTWLRPQPGGGLRVERVVPIDPRPPEIDGPHNLTVAPDHKSYYVSVAHGTPAGALWRLDARTHEVIGIAPAEQYPTTIALTPDGEFAFVANSDFFGDRPRVNPVTIVHTPTMATIVQLPACDMPHGVKSNRAGSTIYISCMHSDELLALDVASLTITQRWRLGAGHADASHDAHAGHAMPAAPATTSGGPNLAGACAATFVSLSPDDRLAYVACNASGTMQVWDVRTGRLVGEVATGAGAYNVEPSPDGRLVIVTNKKDRSISVIDAATIKVLARIPTTKPVVHGIAYAPDGQYAYITQESVGADPGAVDVIDLSTLRVVASVPLPAQPTGITILRTD